MTVFKIGDLVVTPPEANKDYWTPAEIVTIINPDTEEATLVCRMEDGDLVYLGVNEVVHYNPAFTESEHKEKVNTANTTQVGGSHYQKAIQPWDYIIANSLGYLEGNIIKYVSRYKEKNGKQDLEKAKHYLDKLIESLGE